MDAEEYLKWQDAIFQELRDREEISNAREKIIMEKLEWAAKQQRIPLDEFLRRVAKGDAVGKTPWDIRIVNDQERRITLAQWFQAKLPTLWAELRDSK